MPPARLCLLTPPLLPQLPQDSIYTLYNSTLSNSRKIRRVNVEPLQVRPAAAATAPPRPSAGRPACVHCSGAGATGWPAACLPMLVLRCQPAVRPGNCTLVFNVAASCRRVARLSLPPLQFHFHSTSEHLLSGRSTMLEFHLVTKLVKT